MIFKSCRIFDSAKLMEMQPNIATIAELSNIPFLNSVEVIQELQLGLPTYLALAEGTATDTDILQWWARHATVVPKWVSMCRKILLFQPSSAASERVFSLLQNSFTAKQEGAYEDNIETLLMLQYDSDK